MRYDCSSCGPKIAADTPKLAANRVVGLWKRPGLKRREAMMYRDCEVVSLEKRSAAEKPSNELEFHIT